MISKDLALWLCDLNIMTIRETGEKRWGLKEKRTETNVIQMKKKHQPNGSLKEDQLNIIQILQQAPAIDPKVQTFRLHSFGSGVSRGNLAAASWTKWQPTVPDVVLVSVTHKKGIKDPKIALWGCHSSSGFVLFNHLPHSAGSVQGERERTREEERGRERERERENRHFYCSVLLPCQGKSDHRLPRSKHTHGDTHTHGETHSSSPTDCPEVS